jgi:hypothetical protein
MVTERAAASHKNISTTRRFVSLPRAPDLANTGVHISFISVTNAARLVVGRGAVLGAAVGADHVGQLQC